MGQHGAEVVQLAAWRSGRLWRDSKLVALGAGLQGPGGQPLQLELPKLGHEIPGLPVAHVALANAKSARHGDLRLEMLDDVGVGHAGNYRYTHNGIHINSVNCLGNIQEMEAIGDRIKRLRKDLGLNQTELAEAIGVRQSTISDIENGAGFDAKTLMALSKALLKSPQFIMTGEPEAVELSADEANVIAALRAAAEKKAAAARATKKTAEDKSISSPLSKPKTRRRAAA
jgi:transcriptional regulator with XRE-family HTH domain